MSVTAAQLVAEIKVSGASEATIQIKQVGQTVSEAEENAKSAQGVFGEFLKSQLVFSALSAAAGFLRDQIGSIFTLTMDHQSVMAQLTARLKDTRDAVGLSSTAIADYALKLSQVTPFSQDAIMAGQNMLLTFTSIGKSVFPQASHAMVELAQVMGGDMSGAAVMLGKAMDDPVQGISALHRVGVSFTDAQKNLIKQMIATGNTAGAQKEILKILAAQGFGTAAEAAGRTLPGQLAILRNEFDHVKEKIGDALLPILQSLTSFVQTNILPAFDRFSNWMQTTGAPALQNFATFVQHNFQPILAGLAGFVVAVVVPAFWAWAAAMIANPVGLIITGIALAIGALTAGFVALYQHNAGFRAFIDGVAHGFQQAASFVQANFLPAMQRIGQFIMTYVWPVIQQLGAFIASNFVPVWQQLVSLWNSQLLPLFKQLWGAIQPALPAFQFLAAIIGGIVVISLGMLVGVLSAVAKGLAGFLSGIVVVVGGIVQLFTGVVQVVSGIVRFLYDLFTGNFSKLGSDLGTIWQGIINMFQGTWQIISGVFQTAWYTISGIVTGFVQGVIGFFQHLANEIVGHSIIPDMVNSIVNWIAQLPGRVGTWVASMATTILNKLTDLANQAVQAGAHIVEQIAQGILGAIGSALGNAMNSVGAFIQSHLPHSPAKQGPLKTLAEAGANIPAEIARGITAGVPAIQTQLNMMLLPVAQAPLGFSASPQMFQQSLGGTQPQIIVQPPPIYLDGHRLAMGLMPYLMNAIRYGTSAGF